VLVVDDDPTVRKLVRTGLEYAGYRVIDAENGVDALRKLGATKDPVQVLVTDVVMPEMGGVALAEKVLERKPTPQVILMSGFSHDPARLRVLGVTPPFIQKPFRINDIVNLVNIAAGQVT
jgi:DNA-binding NtrC family response regulator